MTKFHNIYAAPPTKSPSVHSSATMYSIHRRDPNVILSILCSLALSVTSLVLSVRCCKPLADGDPSIPRLCPPTIFKRKRTLRSTELRSMFTTYTFSSTNSQQSEFSNSRPTANPRRCGLGRNVCVASRKPTLAAPAPTGSVKTPIPRQKEQEAAKTCGSLPSWVLSQISFTLFVPHAKASIFIDQSQSGISETHPLTSHTVIPYT